MKVLLLGGSGMLGRALHHSFQVIGPEIDINVPSSTELDLRRTAETQAYFKDRKFSLVIHCAGKVGGIQQNIKEPTAFLYDNAMMALNAIHTAAENNVPCFLYFGSSCMYPRDYKNPLKEEFLLEAPLEPTNEGYALAKIIGAKLCEYYQNQFGLSYKTLIPCNLFGPHDKYDSARAHLVPSAIRKIYEAHRDSQPSVSIWGDGTAKREFLFVNDLSDFVVRIAKRVNELPQYLNVGYGTDFSAMDYYSMIKEIIGYRGTFAFDESKPAGMKRKCLDSRRAADLGWKPTTSMETALRKTYEHFLREQNLQ